MSFLRGLIDLGVETGDREGIDAIGAAERPPPARPPPEGGPPSRPMNASKPPEIPPKEPPPSKPPRDIASEAAAGERPPKPPAPKEAPKTEIKVERQEETGAQRMRAAAPIAQVAVAGGLGAWALHDMNQQTTALREGLGGAFTTIGGDLAGGTHNAGAWIAGSASKIADTGSNLATSGVNSVEQGLHQAATGVSNALNRATGGSLTNVADTISLMLEIAAAVGIVYASYRVYRLMRR